MKKRSIYLLCMVLLASCTGQSKQSEPTADSEDKPHYWIPIKDSIKEERTGGHTSVAEDGKLVVVSGMYPDGGTAAEYWNEFKIIKSPGDTLSFDMSNGAYMSNIHAIQKRNGDTYYIVNNYGESSGTQADEWLTAYRFENDTLWQVSVIDGSSDFERLDKGHFYVMYSIPNWYHATNGFGYDWMFEYEAKTGRLFIPLKDKEDYYSLNDRYHVWQFDGSRFVDKGSQTTQGFAP